MKKIILSRTDNLGDVILTLPVSGVLKERFPGSQIIFLGKSYTKPIIDLCKNIDTFVDWDTLKDDEPKALQVIKELNADAIIHVFPDKEICRISKKAGIPLRVATAGRTFTWFTCNKLVKMSRRRSDLHEAELNLKLLKPLGIERIPLRNEIKNYYGLKNGSIPRSIFLKDGDGKINIILHPKSKGSAREWGLDNFSRLIGLLPEEKFNIYVTGTQGEGDMMRDFLEKQKHRIVDLTGKMSLPELIAFINSCDGMVAASTGPLHIAAALGKRAIGLYAPMRPIFPKRWAPLGENAEFLVLDKDCEDCRKSGDCACIRSISAEKVAGLLQKQS